MDHWNNLTPQPRRVLITGGTRGIGKDLAQKMINQGFEVIITARNQKAAEELKLQLDVQKRHLFSYVILNMDSVPAVEKDIPGILEKFNEKPFDIVVLNAGVMFPETRNAKIEPTFMVNYLAHAILADVLVKAKPMEHKVHFVGVSSIMIKYCMWPLMIPPKTKEAMESAFGPKQNFAAGWKEYAFSKVALGQLCVDLNSHLNVTATSVNPGNSPTDIAIRMPGWQRSILRFFFKSTMVPVSIAAERVLFATEIRLASPYNWLNMSDEIPLPGYVIDQKARNELGEFAEKLIGRNKIPDILQ